MSKVDEALKHLHYHLFNEKDVCDRMNPFKLEKIIKQALEDKEKECVAIDNVLSRMLNENMTIVDELKSKLDKIKEIHNGIIPKCDDKNCHYEKMFYETNKILNGME